MGDKPEEETDNGWGAWGAWAANAVKSTTETFSEQANAIADRSINVLAEASEYMQRDLEEFTKVVSEDATNVYSKVAEVTYQSINDYAGEEIAQDAVNIKSTAVSMLGSGLKTLVTGVEQILLESDEESLPELTFEEKINQLESTNETYTSQIENTEFVDWNNEFNSKLDEHKDTITEILIECPTVRRKYNELVPNEVSHNLFWSRYLFRRNEINAHQESKTEDIVITAEPIQVKNTSDDCGVELKSELKESQISKETEELSHDREKPKSPAHPEISVVDSNDVKTESSQASPQEPKLDLAQSNPKPEPKLSKNLTKEVKKKADEEQSTDLNKSSSDEDLVKISKTEKAKEEKEKSDIEDWEDDLDIDDVDITDVNLDDDDWQMSD